MIIEEKIIDGMRVIKHSSGAIERIKQDAVRAVGGALAHETGGTTIKNEMLENQLIIMAALADLYERGL